MIEQKKVPIARDLEIFLIGDYNFTILKLASLSLIFNLKK